MGVITELTLRLLPAEPPASTVVAVFSLVRDATAAILEITRCIRSAMLEFMDRVTIGAVETQARMGLGSRRRGDGYRAATKNLRHRRSLTCALSTGATEVFSTHDAADGEAFTAAHRLAIPAVELRRLGERLLEDVGVPLVALADLIVGIEVIAAERGVVCAVIAHAGDGNTRPLIVYDGGDSDQTARAHGAFGEIMDLAIALGGTITGEHGVGAEEGVVARSSLMELTRRIRAALDPHD